MMTIMYLLLVRGRRQIDFVPDSGFVPRWGGSIETAITRNIGSITVSVSYFVFVELFTYQSNELIKGE